MKKVFTSHSELFNQQVTITIDERLGKLKPENLAPKKLEEANRHLRKMKSLPK
jgi:hypothetical protein